MNRVQRRVLRVPIRGGGGGCGIQGQGNVNRQGLAFQQYRGSPPDAPSPAKRKRNDIEPGECNNSPAASLPPAVSHPNIGMIPPLPNFQSDLRVDKSSVAPYLDLPISQLLELDVMRPNSSGKLMALKLDGHGESVKDLVMRNEFSESKFRQIFEQMLEHPERISSTENAVELKNAVEEPVASANEIVNTLSNQVAFAEHLSAAKKEAISKKRAIDLRELQEQIAKLKKDYQDRDNVRLAEESELSGLDKHVSEARNYVDEANGTVKQTSERANLVQEFINCPVSNRHHTNMTWSCIGVKLIPLVKGFDDSLLIKSFSRELVEHSKSQTSHSDQLTLAGLSIDDYPTIDDQSAVTLPTFFANGVTESNEAHGHVLPTTTSVEETPFQSASTSNGPKADDDSLLSVNMNMSVNSSVAPPLATGIHTAVQKTPVFKSADVSDNVSTTDTEATEMSMGLKSIPSITGSSVKASAASGVPGRQQGGPTLPSVEDGKLIWFVFLLSSTM